jgi:nucleoside-diphosphate-sugar epimerase
VKALVTGGTGFLGSHVASRLAQDGMAVTIIGRDVERGKASENQKIEFELCDLGDLQALRRLARDQDYIVHCGALSSPWGKYRDFYLANVLGTENILKAAKESSLKRFVHVSTPSIYADQSDRLQVKEGDPLPQKPINYYSATKKLAEEKVDEAFRDGLPAVTIRPQAIFGPGDRAILPRIVRAAEKGMLPIIGTGTSQMDVTYVSNVVDSIVLCMNAPSNVLGKKYNVTNGEPCELYTLISEILERLGIRYRTRKLSFSRAYFIASVLEGFYRLSPRGTEPPLTRYSVCVLGKSRVLDITQARRDLGYQPKVSVREGMELFCADWKRKNGNAG